MTGLRVHPAGSAGIGAADMRGHAPLASGALLRHHEL
jgi:hypothetical protein